MFYCEPCRTANNWPGIIPTSYGECEMCGSVEPCHDSKPPKPPKTWTLPPEPGPEVTHVKDRYRDVWRRGNGVWVYRNSVGNEAIWPWNVLFEKGYPLTDVSAEYGIDRDIFDGVE